MPHVASCHIKDATRTKTPGTWGDEVVVGTGEVDWPAFFATLVTWAASRARSRSSARPAPSRVADIQTAHRFVRSVLG